MRLLALALLLVSLPAWAEQQAALPADPEGTPEQALAQLDQEIAALRQHPDLQAIDIRVEKLEPARQADLDAKPRDEARRARLLAAIADRPTLVQVLENNLARPDQVVALDVTPSGRVVVYVRRRDEP